MKVGEATPYDGSTQQAGRVDPVKWNAALTAAIDKTKPTPEPQESGGTPPPPVPTPPR